MVGTWMEAFANFAFPTAVAVYVLVRLEPNLAKQNISILKAVQSLESTVTVLTIVIAKNTGVDYQEARRWVNRNGGDKQC